MSKSDSTRWLDWRVDQEGHSIRTVRECDCGRRFTPSGPEHDTCGPCIQDRKQTVSALMDVEERAFVDQQMESLAELERIRAEARREGLA